MDIKLILEYFTKFSWMLLSIIFQNIFFAFDFELTSVEDGNTTNVILCLVDEFGKF